MKRLRIDLTELADAFELGGPEVSYYLDSETGEVLMVSAEASHLLDRIYQGVDAGERAQIDFDAALDARGVADWEREMVKTAQRIDSGYGSRYIQVPQSDSFEGYADMKAFIESLTDLRFADRLWSAIQGKGAFRRFKDVLATQPTLEERWFAFKAAQVQQRLGDWLAAHEIEAEKTSQRVAGE